MHLKKLFSKSPINYLLLIIFLWLICLPRFNRNDWGIIKHITSHEGLTFVSDRGVFYDNLSTDAQQYLYFVKYFRTPSPETTSSLKAPFCYRPLEPFIASLLPFDESTSLNLLNVILLTLGFILMGQILQKLGINGISKTISLFLYAFSFPVFYYGAISYIDPILIFFMLAGFYLLLIEQWVLFPVLIFTGTLGKEGILILLPVAIVLSITNNKLNMKAFLTITLSIGAYFFATFLSRSFFHQNEQYLWVPSIDSVLMNLTRARAYVSILISFGIPGIFSVLHIANVITKGTWKNQICFIPLVTGLFTSLAFCLFGMITVYADGRYIWPSYVFSIPLAAQYIESLQICYKKSAIPYCTMQSKEIALQNVVKQY